MKITAWMVILDDEYYADMAIKSILPYVDAIYVQDQGCTDGSIDVIREAAGEGVRLFIEEGVHGLPRFHPEYNEPLYRSRAIERAEEIFGNPWLLQIDADDVYTPHFFETVFEREAAGELEPINSFRHSSERFITPQYRSQSDHAKQIIDGEPYYDPHTRLWRAGLGTQYIPNPAFPGSHFHGILHPEPMPVMWIKGVCNIHLHRSFGPKAFVFWAEGGDEFEYTRPFNPRRQAPKWFNHTVNMGEAVRCDHDWPDYILDKWNEWGEYDL